MSLILIIPIGETRVPVIFADALEPFTAGITCARVTNWDSNRMNKKINRKRNVFKQE